MHGVQQDELLGKLYHYRMNHHGQRKTESVVASPMRKKNQRTTHLINQKTTPVKFVSHSHTVGVPASSAQCFNYHLTSCTTLQNKGLQSSIATASLLIKSNQFMSYHLAGYHVHASRLRVAYPSIYLCACTNIQTESGLPIYLPMCLYKHPE